MFIDLQNKLHMNLIGSLIMLNESSETSIVAIVAMNP
jgi:hypothetical protein